MRIRIVAYQLICIRFGLVKPFLLTKLCLLTRRMAQKNFLFFFAVCMSPSLKVRSSITINSIAAQAINTPARSRNITIKSASAQNINLNASKTLLDQFYTWDASDNLIAKF
jgi:hypothetical protein